MCEELVSRGDEHHIPPLFKRIAVQLFRYHKDVSNHNCHFGGLSSIGALTSGLRKQKCGVEIDLVCLATVKV